MDDIRNVDVGPNAEADFYDLQLVVTKSCNLNCKYCYVQQTNEFMTLETAQNAVRAGHEKATAQGLPLMISFMGGEPFLAFPLIQSLCEWTWETYSDEKIYFYSPTNGTILTDQMRKWLSVHKNQITIALSYDSFFFQEKNRTKGGQGVDVTFFRRLWPNQRFKMTISESNVSDLASAIISMEQMGIPFAANIAFGEPAWQEPSFDIYAREIFKLTAFYAEHPGIEPCDLFAMDFQLVFLQKIPMLRRCGIGLNYENIDCDGKSYPCHMFSPLALDSTKVISVADYDFSGRSDFTVSDCVSCPLSQVCPKCYGMSYLRTGNPFRADRNVCKTFQIQARAACILMIKRLCTKNKLTETELMTVSAIKRIVREMNWDLSRNKWKESAI